MLRVYLTLIFGVIIVSSSSILIRWTGNVPFTVIAFYRVFISFCLLLIYSLSKSGFKFQTLIKWHWHYILAGFFLAAHFITWIASLQLTSIANSIFLESMHPLFGVLVSIIFLKEFPRRKILPALVLAIIGVFIIVSTDMDHSEDHLSGDLLAIVSALCLAFYLMIARKHKGEQDFIKYLIYIYGAASLFSAIYLLLKDDLFWGYTTESWMFIFFLAIGPNLIGHSILNWSARHIQIFKVNLVMLLEPVLATLSGIIFIAEFPPPTFYLGAALVLISLWFLIEQDERKYLSQR